MVGLQQEVYVKQDYFTIYLAVEKNTFVFMINVDFNNLSPYVFINRGSFVNWKLSECFFPREHIAGVSVYWTRCDLNGEQSGSSHHGSDS